MQKLRENPLFKVLALCLGLCFALLVFHSVLHLEHVIEEGEHCSVCLVLSMLAIIFAAAFILLEQRHEENKGFRRFFCIDIPCQPFIKLLAGRAPPRAI